MAKSGDTNTVRYVRRMPREAYGHEEAEIILAVNDGDDAFDILAKAKEDVLDILDGKFGEGGITADQFVPGPTTSELIQEAADKVAAAEPVTPEPEIEVSEDVGQVEEPAAPEKKKRGRKTKAAPKVEEDEIEVEGDNDFGFDEDEDEAPKKKRKVKKASTPFDRSNKTHQSMISGLFTEIMPTWKQDLDKASLKQLAQDLNGKGFLDEDGEILTSFEHSVREFFSDELS